MKQRYSTYKSSGVEWIGEIPIHWDYKKLKHTVDYKNGCSFKSDDFSLDEKIPVIRIGEVGDEIDFNECVKLPESFLDKYKEFEIKKDDVLIGLTGGTIGKSGRYKYDTPSLLNQRVCLLRNRENIRNGFLYYYVKSEVFIRYIMFDCYGGGQDNIGKDEILNMRVPLPPLPEQEQIVKYLDEKTSQVDGLISITEKKIELLKQKRTSLINEVVTKGLNKDVELKDSGVEWIGEIPKDWERTKMKHITKIFGRIGYRGYTIEDIVNEGEGVITISPSNVKNDIFTIENENTYISYEKYFQSPEIMIFPNDIILVKTGSTIGKTSIIPENVPEMTINPQLIVLKEIKLFPKYLYYQTVCKFIKESFDVEQTGSTTPTISQEKINEFPILNPPIEEQKQIVKYLDTHTTEIDKLVSIEQRRIETLKEYRQSLISEVVTGKIKVSKEIF
jgi:type I restriction enzyme, S subunit